MYKPSLHGILKNILNNFQPFRPISYVMIEALVFPESQSADARVSETATDVSRDHSSSAFSRTSFSSSIRPRTSFGKEPASVLTLKFAEITQPACGAGDSIEPGAQAPGRIRARLRARESGRQRPCWLPALCTAEVSDARPSLSVARSRGLLIFADSNMGFRCCSTPGFTLSPAPQAEYKSPFLFSVLQSQGARRKVRNRAVLTG
jgi:hypothetical protein